MWLKGFAKLPSVWMLEIPPLAVCEVLGRSSPLCQALVSLLQNHVLSLAWGEWECASYGFFSVSPEPCLNMLVQALPGSLKRLQGPRTSTL